MNVQLDYNTLGSDYLSADVTFSTFPAGERYVKIPTDIQQPTFFLVTLQAASAEAIIDAILLADALKYAYPTVHKFLYAPYFPYSRQDRVCSLGESNSFKVISDLLLTHYDYIETIDLHNLAVCPTKVFSEACEYDLSKYILVHKLTDFNPETAHYVAVDKGAYQRVEQFAINNNCENQLTLLSKKRDENAISQQIDFAPSTLISASDIVIIDDICDGGATFINAVNVLRTINPTAHYHLVVSHGIFSKGIDVLTPYFSSIYMNNHAFNRHRQSSR